MDKIKTQDGQSCAASSAIHFYGGENFVLKFCIYRFGLDGLHSINIHQPTINVKSLDRIVCISIFYRYGTKINPR